MVEGKLTFFEKRTLSNRGQIDASCRLFRDYSTGRMYPFQTKWTNLPVPAQPQDTDAPKKAEHEEHLQKGKQNNVQLLSAFMLAEIQSFCAMRDRIFTRADCVVRVLYDEKKERLKKGFYIYRFSNAVELLERQISDSQERISGLMHKYNEELSNLRKQKEDRKADDIPEYVQMFADKESELRKKYINDSEKEKNIFFVLIDEKIRLLENMQVKINKLFSHQNLRLAYYYDSANQAVSTLPVTYINIKILMQLCNATVMGKYENCVSEAKKRKIAVKTEDI